MHSRHCLRQALFASHARVGTGSSLELESGRLPSRCPSVMTPNHHLSLPISRPRYQTFHHSSFENAQASSSQTYDPKHPTNVTINIKDNVKIISLGQGIINVVLSRPNKLNSLDMGMFEAIAEAASRLRSDRELNKDLRVVIISGEGRAFCSGLDAKGVALSGPKSSLNRLLQRPSDYGGEKGVGNLAQDVSYLWRKLPVPVIAVLHGYCFGGGLQIALGADLRFATPDCKLSIMESKWGLIPDMSASIFLRELVRMDVAKELTMTGRIISGSEAESLGLVTRCVDDPMEEAMKVAGEIIARSPDSVAASKELFQSTWMVPDDATCLETETTLQLKLIGTWNQAAAAGRQFGVNLPYWNNRDTTKG
jgi:enoyl-CoA hydratase/carnithine racemase